MLSEIKFKAKRVADERYVFGSYMDYSCGIVDNNNQYHAIYIDTLEQFIGLVDAEGNDIYSGDMLYSNDGKEAYFSYKWNSCHLYYWRDGHIPDNTSIVVNKGKHKIENFSLVKTELTKEQFLCKYFLKSLYSISDPEAYLKLQAIAISLGFKSEYGSVDVKYVENPVNLCMFPADDHRDYKRFANSFGYLPSYFTKCNFEEMIKEYKRIYNEQ